MTKSVVCKIVVMVLVLVVLAACDKIENEAHAPVRVSVHILRWHANELPDKLLELDGYYVKDSHTGTPRFYSTRQDAVMSSESESIGVLLSGNNDSEFTCVDGYLKAFGYMKDSYFWAFSFAQFGDDWQTGDACWATDFDWQKSPAHSHLYP